MGRSKYRTRNPYVGERKKTSMRRTKHEVLTHLSENHEEDELVSSQEENKTESASSRKLKYFGVTVEEGKDNADNSTSEPEDCYLIVQKSIMAKLVSTLLCPECKQPGLSFQVSSENKNGFSVKSSIVCQTCKVFAKEQYLCERVGGSSSPNSPWDINTRAILAFRGIGCGYTAMRDWASVMNMPYTISRDTYTKGHQKIEESSAKTFELISEQSRTNIEKAYEEVGGTTR